MTRRPSSWGRVEFTADNDGTGVLAVASRVRLARALSKASGMTDGTLGIWWFFFCPGFLVLCCVCLVSEVELDFASAGPRF